MTSSKRILVGFAAVLLAMGNLLPADSLGKSIIRQLAPQQRIVRGRCGMEIYRRPPRPPAPDPYSTKGVKQGDDCVFFTGGSRVSGRIVEIAPDGTVKIASPHFPKPLLVRCRAVKQVKFGGKDAIAAGPDTVVLTNGNRVRGEIREITSAAVLIQTKSIGEMTNRRGVVARVDFQPVSEARALKSADRVLLTSGDRLSGTLVSLKGGVANLEAPYGKLAVKKGELRTIVFRSKGRETLPKESGGKVTLAFHGGEELTVRIKKMDSEAIESTADILGDLRILRGAIRQIRFEA